VGLKIKQIRSPIDLRICGCHDTTLSGCAAVVVIVGVVFVACVGVVMIMILTAMVSLALAGAFIVVVLVVHLYSTSFRMILYNASIF